MSSPAPPPELSVVIVAGESFPRVHTCLRSVLEQDGFDRGEILLIDCARADSQAQFAELTESLGEDRFRVVRPPTGAHYGDALALGVRLARAPVVAFLEEHARAHPGWASALIEAHRGPAAAVACEVHVGNPGLGLSDGWGLLGYSLWYAPLEGGEALFVHGYNAACKRDVLLSYGDFLGDLLLADTAFAYRLRQDGHRLENCPGAKIDHLNETELLLPLRKSYLAHRFSAPTRAAACRWTWRRRFVYVAGLPLLPLYGLWNQIRWIRRHRPHLAPTLLRCFPQLALAHLANALGAFLGLTIGPGRAAERFTWLELNNHRPESQS